LKHRLCGIRFYVSKAGAAEATENKVDIGVEGHGSHSRNSLNLLASACPRLPAQHLSNGGRDDHKRRPPTRVVCAPRVSGAAVPGKPIGGGTLGCNWQPVGSPFVLGIEGEVGYMKLEGSAFDPLINR
jgi:hypothetical protein